MISERHARIIVETIDALPDAVRAEHGARIAAELVGYAGQFDPHQLAKLALRMSYCYDPDGRYKDVDYPATQRALSVQQRPDGSATITGQATAELTEFLLLHFDALARPRPSTGSSSPCAPRRYPASPGSPRPSS